MLLEGGLFMTLLYNLCFAQVLLEGDFAYRMDEFGTCMYFLQTGYVQVSPYALSVCFIPGLRPFILYTLYFMPALRQGG